MTIVGDLIGLFVIAFLALAILSTFTTKTPRTPPFAGRAASSSSPQLRHDPNARFFTDRGFLFRRRRWFVATCCPPVRIATANYQSLSAAARHRPVQVARTVSTFDLQYDHVIPVALGGATSEQNLQLLCAGCNREKDGNL